MLEVLNEGVSVAEVAARAGVTRQTVHRWLRNYARDGLAGLVDKSSAPGSCPHQMDPVVEARIVALRQEHPGWGPRTLGHRLGREGFDPVPGRSSIYRCLVRHHLTSRNPLAAPHVLRQMLPGDALLIHGTLPPAHVRTRPYYRERALRRRAALPVPARPTERPSAVMEVTTDAAN